MEPNPKSTGPIDPGHQQKRAVLRVLGPLILAAGAILVLVGVGSFFSSFGGSGPPKYFWCAFLGMPVGFVGLVMTQAAFAGAAARYFAEEAAPVGKDTFNYMADGTKDGVKTVATAVGEGISAGMAAGRPAQIRCHKCNQANDADAKFCKSCGVSLTKSKPCPACNELNDPDASFCDHCGRTLA